MYASTFAKQLFHIHLGYGVHTEPRGAVGKGPADAAAGAEGEGVVGPTPVADEVAVGVAPRA